MPQPAVRSRVTLHLTLRLVIGRSCVDVTRQGAGSRRRKPHYCTVTHAQCGQHDTAAHSSICEGREVWNRSHIDHHTAYNSSMNAPHEYRCRYTGSRCGNVRAKKLNGQLHNLCEMHRAKANENQKRIDERKRSLKQLVNEDGTDRHVQQGGEEGNEKPPAAPSQAFKEEDGDEGLDDNALELDDAEIENLTSLVVTNVLQENSSEPEELARIE